MTQEKWSKMKSNGEKQSKNVKKILYKSVGLCYFDNVAGKELREELPWKQKRERR
jgi:hypothetical protein